MQSCHFLGTFIELHASTFLFVACKRRKLREMLSGTWELRQRLKDIVMEKDVGVDIGNDIIKIEPIEFEHSRPRVLCEQLGKVFTKNRLCGE